MAPKAPKGLRRAKLVKVAGHVALGRSVLSDAEAACASVMSLKASTYP